MLLAIEQGNTNSLFAVHDGENWIAQWRSATQPSRTADEYVVWLSQLMAMHKLEFSLLNACVISSVVPQSIFNLRNLSRRHLHVEPIDNRREYRARHPGADQQTLRGRIGPSWSTRSARSRSTPGL